MDSDTSTDQPGAEPITQPPSDTRPAGFWIRAVDNILDSFVIMTGSIRALAKYLNALTLNLGWLVAA